MSNYLISWIDKADLKAGLSNFEGDLIGPVLNTLIHERFEKAFILNGYNNNADAEGFGASLEGFLNNKGINTSIEQLNASIKNPIDFDSRN